MLQTRQLQFHYQEGGTFNFPDISCRAGDALLVTGASGVGKTTFLHLLGGLIQPTSGMVIIDNEKISVMREKDRDRFRGQYIGIVFQRSHFVASLSVLENLTLASWLANGEKQTERAKQLLETLGLQDQMHKKAARMSIGQQQRAAIARALMNHPKVLLADEPTSSLDDPNAALVAQMLHEQAQKAGAALVIVTHDHRLRERFDQIQPLS